ncbi:MAG TPA: hypothetical protein VKP30_21215 [Polyangiaceae bacterium]|nr:hypothetical protein [Polyangiaceae bacterium]
MTQQVAIEQRATLDLGVLRRSRGAPATGAGIFVCIDGRSRGAPATGAGIFVCTDG